ncbi:Rz1 family lipoprotein [Cedecea sp. FDAARGOS_727]|uniref:Rz1 family lipoprotein n=1 Tax=Cedecea sp. FDAARGOS_727 TaxID=2545798 RepID=UPI001558A7D0
MPNRLLSSCSLTLLLVISGCASTPPASQCVPPPAPPAWMMQPAPDLLTPLNGIISVSGNESKPATSK